MSTIQTVNFPFTGENWIQGDTLSKSVVTITEAGIDLTTSTIAMQIYNRNAKVVDVNNTTGGITVISANVFEIDEVLATDNNLPVGCSEGDLEITDANGVRLTYFRVIYTIQKQYTTV
jgi:hypothetical protein